MSTSRRAAAAGTSSSRGSGYVIAAAQRRVGIGAQRDASQLFESPPQLPHGLVYRPGFVTPAEEAWLLGRIEPLPFREARFGEFVARRRVVHFHAGGDVDSDDPYDDGESFSIGPLPAFLVGLQQRLADAFGIERAALVHTLITEYRPGAPIGWHRDKAVYGTIFGLSLRGRGTMRFRRIDPAADRGRSAMLQLEPRSLYVIKGPIRWLWQHSMLPAAELRYSITFRTRAAEEAIAA